MADPTAWGRTAIRRGGVKATSPVHSEHGCRLWSSYSFYKLWPRSWWAGVRASHSVCSVVYITSSWPFSGRILPRGRESKLPRSEQIRGHRGNCPRRIASSCHWSVIDSRGGKGQGKWNTCRWPMVRRCTARTRRLARRASHGRVSFHIRTFAWREAISKFLEVNRGKEVIIPIRGIGVFITRRGGPGEEDREGEEGGNWRSLLSSAKPATV